MVKRMNDLLEEIFPAEDATLRHLESEEFRRFSDDLKTSLASINDTLKQIQSNSQNITKILQNQAQSMDSYFKDSMQAKRLSEEYTKAHRDWERYVLHKGI